MKKIIWLSAASAMVLLSGCSKQKAFVSDNFAVSPTPLEYVAGEVPATISINVPAKAMNKKAVVECTPVLKWDGGASAGDPFTLQGEKVEANNTIISFKNGGHATMRFSVPFVDGMEKSDLMMQFNAKVGKKTVKMPTVKIGYGTQCTASLITKTAKTANFGVAPDNFQRIISQKQEAAVKFLIGQANLRGSELNTQTVQDFIKTLKNIKSDEQSLVLNNIEVSAYASPDGAYAINERLAEKRGAVSEGYVNQQLKQNQLATNVDTKYTAEDWEGFQELVAASDIQDKDVILRVLSMYKDPEEREQQIKAISSAFRELADGILPQLRRARMIANYELIGRDDEQILAQIKEDPSKLSVEELLYGATLYDNDLKGAANAYQKAVDLYPNDARAYNNLATIAYAQGDYAKAKEWLQRALGKDNKVAEANANLGLLALQAGNLSEAENYIARGSSANGVNEIIGNLHLAQGKYAQAQQDFGSLKTNSAALAQLLNKDYAAAANTLNGVANPDGTTAYLQAIVASRIGNKSDAANALEKALKLDPSLRSYANKDLELMK